MKYDCLIVDDELELANNTCEYLNMFEVKSYACYSKKDYEEFFKENSTSLILLDINLKDGSGFDICKEIRKEKDIPILFISARNTDDDKIIALTIGGDDYIEKPYSLGVLLAKVKASKIIDKYKDKYGESITATVDFEELIESQMTTFINVANLMVIIMSIISGCIILLVLYLLTKTLIFNRKYEYGILKALGYRSKDLIIQNVLSFMPTIIIAALLGTFVSYHISNPYIGLMMRSFGIMKCNMILPMDLMIITVLFIIGIALFATILMSLKIRKVEPCNLLKSE